MDEDEAKQKAMYRISRLLSRPYAEEQDYELAEELAKENDIPFSRELFDTFIEVAADRGAWNSSNCY